ncbi:MAG: hypothetical protein ACXWEY_07525 [Bacteroidia bacterium]
MKLILSLVFILMFGFCAEAQQKIMVNQSYFGLPSYQTTTKEVDSLAELPPKIQVTIQNLFKYSMPDFINNIEFKRGQNIDVEKALVNDSDTVFDEKYIIPKYQLFFELADSQINIGKYCFELSFDQFGQITYFGWPRENYGKRDDFVSADKIHKNAMKFAQKKKYKTDVFVYELVYDDKMDIITWQISFLQESTGDEYNYSKSYKTIVLNASSSKIINELEMSSVGVVD